jgi:hypothetical protein
VNVMSLRRALGGIAAADFSDPTNERIIYMCAGGLAIVGLGLLVGTLVWWRRGRQEHPALAPLEVMSRRAWANAPEGDRRRRLEQVRLAGAAGSVNERVASEQVDLEALVRSVPQAFDDLREPSAVIDAPDAEPVAEESGAVEPDVDAVAATPDGEVEEAKEEPTVAPAEPDAKPEDVEPVAKPENASPPVDPDATSISTERPKVSPESSAKVPTAPSE